MKGFQKTALQKKGGVRRVRFDKFRLTDEGEKGAFWALDSWNCDCREGRLRRGIACETIMDGFGNTVNVRFEGEIVAVYPFTTDGGKEALCFVAEDGYLYSLKLTTGAATQRVLLGEYPAHLSMRTPAQEVYHLFVGTRGGFVTRDGSSFTRVAEAAEGNIRGCCMAGKRFFVGINESTVAYSAPYDPLQWAGAAHEGGLLYMPADCGALVGLAAEKEQVYLFGEYGVYRVGVRADAKAFTVERLCYGGGAIVPRSAVCTGAGILFLSVDGLYRIQGEKVEKTFSAFFDPPMEGVECYVGRCEELTLLDYVTTEGEMLRLAVYEDGKDAFYADWVKRLGGNEYFFKTGVLQRYVRDRNGAESVYEPYVKSGYLSFGKKGKKTLKRLRVYGEGQVTVRVSNGRVENEYVIDTQNGEGETLLCERGDAFSFYLRPAVWCTLKGMDVEYTCMEE